MSHKTNDPSTVSSKVAMLRQRAAEAKKLGIQIRSEWLGGETGGACEIGGKRWIFLDLSLSVEEQLEQVEDALRQWDAQPAQHAPVANASDSGHTSDSGHAPRSVR